MAKIDCRKEKECVKPGYCENTNASWFLFKANNARCYQWISARCAHAASRQASFASTWSWHTRAGPDGAGTELKTATSGHYGVRRYGRRGAGRPGSLFRVRVRKGWALGLGVPAYPCRAIYCPPVGWKCEVWPAKWRWKDRIDDLAHSA